VAATARITVLEGVSVTAIEGDERVTAVRLAGAAGERRLAVDGVVVKVGALPNTEWCAGVLERDAACYLRVDARLRTGVGRVWAAGDVTRPALPSLTVALGHGALAVADARAVLRGASDAPAGRAGRD
jgi:thioredoxin reductase